MKYDSLNLYFGATEMYSDLDRNNAIEALCQAVRCNTVSYADKSKMDGGEFHKLHAILEKHFPLVHETMRKEIVSDWSLLYCWKGTDPSLKPVLFMAHQDTVPVAPGTEGDWLHPPFSGELADGFIWGRGAIDTKSLVVGQLAAAEYLIAHGYQPKRDIYYAYGQDEESMGYNGAQCIFELLASRGIQLEFVMDEGGSFTKGADFGAPDLLIAKVDVCEKGYADVAVVANSSGGHSSRPGKSTALGQVAKALAAIEENQFKPQLGEVTEAFFKAIAPYATEEPFKTYLSDLPKYKDNLARHLVDNDALAPLVHTTTAETMISGSPAPNVLPQKVEAIINFRLAPWDSCVGVVEHCKKAANNPNLDIHLVRGMEPSQVSATESFGMDMIKASTEKFYKGFKVVPGMVFGGTDCRYFEGICDCCYRFRPFIDNMALRATVHGTNERSSIDSFGYGIKVLIDIMRNACC